MDESRILPVSQPFIIVRFINTNKFVSTTFEVAGTGSKYAAEDITFKPGIVSLQTEGLASIARKATVRLVDPTLYITKAIMQSSAVSQRNPGNPDIQIIWGWKYLLPASEKYYAIKQEDSTDGGIVESSITAMMLKTKFDINEQGVTEIEIETIETSVPLYGGATFVAPIDIMNWKLLKQGNSLSEDQLTKQSTGSKNVYSGSDCFIKKLEQFLNNSASLKLSAGNGKDHANIQFTFTTEGFQTKDTVTGKMIGSSDWNKIFGEDYIKAGNDTFFRDVKINYNESFENFINEVFSKIPKQENNEGTYEIIENERVNATYKDDPDPKRVGLKVIDVPGYTNIKYGWKKAVANEEGSSTKAIDNIPISYVLRWGAESFQDDEKDAKGDKKFYDVQSNGYSKRGAYKYLINWSSDLNSKTYLHFLAQTELQNGLKQFDQKSMEYIVDQLNQGKSFDQIRSSAASEGSSASSDLSAGVGQIISTQGHCKSMAQALATTSSGISSQLSSIVSNNVFKATATVIGDPDLGSKVVPFQYGVSTDFSNTHFGETFEDSDSSDTNLRAFSKKWMITKVVHKIESGNYTTDIELITYPGV